MEPERVEDPIAIVTGLYQVEDGGSGRRLSLLICSGEQRTYPNRPFFVESETLEGKHARVFCPECKKKHDVTSLTEALEGGWLDLQSSHFDDEHAQGFVVDPRVLLTNAIRWIREAGPQVNRRGGITAV